MGGSELLAGYTRLEFLQGTGSQYLATDVIPTNETGILLDTQAVTSNDVIPCGCRTSNTRAERYYALRAPITLKAGGYAGGYGWGEWVRFEATSAHYRDATRLNWLNNRLAVCKEYTGELPALPFAPSLPLYIFAANIAGSPSLCFDGRIWRVAISQGESLIRNYVPALNPAGEPCMLDTRTGAELKNEGDGQFVAGVASTAQLRSLLSRLSHNTRSTETLTLSLPAEANTPEVSAELQACQDRTGRMLTVYEFRSAAASTYSLRRVRQVVWCRMAESEHGPYADTSGTRWRIERCAAIYGPLGNDPAAYGYHPFDNEDQAAEAWSLTPYQHPEQELNPNQ